MKFISSKQDTSRFVEKIFAVTQAAKADLDPNTINATAGCLYDESGKLFTYKTVFNAEKELSDAQKASYASSPTGNKEYIDAISKYILEDKVSNNHMAMATPGGTGALYTSMKLTLQENDTIIIPEIAWANYKNMAIELNLNVLTYNMYNLDDLFNKIDSIKNNKVFILINSPCENPLGYSYSYCQWQQIFNKLNNINKDVVLCLDIAYIDYCTHEPKKFFELFNSISDNLLIMICASCSKSFSYYGERLGALIVVNNDKEIVDTLINIGSRFARSMWSNINNGAMVNVANVLNNHYDEYIKERNESIELLAKRTRLFKQEADECGLELYPFDDGFFVTIKVEDNEVKEKAHKRLIENHIYTINVNKGLRVALCSVPLNKVSGLAKKIKELI